MKLKLIAIPFVFLLAMPNAFSQETNSFKGTWEGTINVGVELRLVFHISIKESGQLTSTLDSPDQLAYGMKCDTVYTAGNGITIEMHKLKATFTGKQISDSTIDGNFTQGSPFPLLLKKVVKASVKIRPQDPVAPFPYKSEDVEYENADHSLHYGATITIPEGKGPFPAALLITGSGAQDRDEALMGHRPFAVIADDLTRHGYIVLRVDDRGVGKSTGKFSEATSADFADDANASFNYLLSRPEVDKKKAGLIGHSEGGMIAPMVASKRTDVDFVVLLAGPGIKIIDLMAAQNEAILRSSGISQPALDAYAPIYREIASTIVNTSDTAAARIKLQISLYKWSSSTDSSLLKQLGFSSLNDGNEMINAMMKVYSSKWFRYFMQFDPQPYLEKLKCKVLALNGEKDIQVIAGPNLAGIETSLKKGGNKSYTIKQMPGLNHLFQTCTKCTVAEYGQIEETFSPTALELINQWLDKEVK